eukprot:c15851_g1_i3.p1 GENE.c15851_g1_i3~~c15851_g1_i3.p1  ORF type:complete len:141 (+),score=25.15 c15851_g1_i3:144-566(+)
MSTDDGLSIITKQVDGRKHPASIVTDMFRSADNKSTNKKVYYPIVRRGLGGDRPDLALSHYSRLVIFAAAACTRAANLSKQITVDDSDYMTARARHGMQVMEANVSGKLQKFTRRMSRLGTRESASASLSSATNGTQKAD